MKPRCLKSDMKSQGPPSGIPFAGKRGAMIKKRAFSLVEILVVVVIIGIIAMVGIPTFSKFYQMYKFRTAMSQLVNDLRAARQAAITNGFPVKITAITLSQYPQIRNVSGGYAVYFLMGQSNIPTTGGAMGNVAATVANWKELAPGHIACGQRAERPRFLSFPVEILSSASNLKDIDGDSLSDLVFQPDGSVFKGPYPANKNAPAATDFLTFSESASDPKNASPRWTLSTVAKISFDRFCVSFAMFGKISVYPYHS